MGPGLAESHSQANLKKNFNSAVAQSAHPTPGDNPAVGAATTTTPGRAVSGAIDHLVIPKIGVDKYVVQGVSEDDLREGPGHYPQTVLPGQKGNAAIAGHRTTYGAPFFRLNELSVGDDIYITDTAGRSFVYRVSSPPVVVSPSDVAVLDPAPYAQLTLTTCNPRYSATSRLIVFARLTNRPPLPVTAPAPVPTTTQAPVAASVAAGRQPGDGRQRRLAGRPPLRRPLPCPVDRRPRAAHPHPAVGPVGRVRRRGGAVPDPAVVPLRERHAAPAPKHLSGPDR